MSKLSVGVVFGGRSVEHDVSIVSAHQAMAVLGAGHTVVPIYVTRGGRWLSSPALNDLEVYRTGRWDEVAQEAFISPVAGYGGLHVPATGRFAKARRIPLDVVVPAIHGTYGEDGTLQGLLDLADLPYVGSGTSGSAVGMDKVVMKAAFRDAGLPVVDHYLAEAGRLGANPEAVLDEIERAIGYPCFVKPSRLGSSVGIGRAAERAALIEALEVAKRYDRRILVEPSMEGCSEVNCSVLGGAGHEPHASVCEQPLRAEEFLSFSDKYLRGRKGSGAPGTKESGGLAAAGRRIPAPISEPLTKQVQHNALGAFKAVDASGVARVDCFVNEATGQTWVMEINTVPGSFSFYLWEPSGVGFEQLMADLINIAIASHAQRSGLLFSFESEMLSDLGGQKAGG